MTFQRYSWALEFLQTLLPKRKKKEELPMMDAEESQNHLTGPWTGPGKQ